MSAQPVKAFTVNVVEDFSDTSTKNTGTVHIIIRTHTNKQDQGIKKKQNITGLQ